MVDAVDVTDPCAMVDALKQAKAELLLGKRAVRVSFSSGNVTHDVQLQSAAMADINAAINEYSHLCEEASSEKPRRHAI